MTAVRSTLVNGRWELWLPEHRAARPEWPWWEAQRLAAMHHVIAAGSDQVVWDVGAEEGDFPALWASWGAQVVLAEPNPRVWPNIKLVWEANALPDPLATWVGFLGAEVTQPPGAGERVDSIWPPCADGEVIGDHGFCQLGERPDLPTTTVDRMVDLGVPAPTVLTMDVEGSELLVLRGAAATLEHRRPHVFVSIHEEFMAHHYGIRDGVQNIRAFMRDAGYAWGDHVFLGTDHEAHWWFPPQAVR